MPRGLAAILGPFTGLALHARRLGFSHPGDGTWREFTAPLPEEFRNVLDALGRPPMEPHGADRGIR